MVVWETRNYGPKVRETSFPTRKLAGGERKVVSEEKGGLQEEKVVSHPCTTFQTRKTRFVPKTNQHGCKTRVWEAKRAAGSLEN